MARIFTLKGKTAEDLAKVNLEDFAKMLPSRQRRTLLRGFSPKQKKFLEKIRASSKPVRTHLREVVIIPEMVGKRVLLYNGKEWVALDVRADMLGHRLGEFAMTRKRVMHSSPGVGATKSSKFLPLK
jgi:small subunit ribosomal protein S19